MSCCSDPKPGTRNAGSCCGASQPFPWFSALCDPAVGKMFFQRFWPELLLGLAAGCLAGALVLYLGEGLVGALGPLMNGSLLHFHAAAVLPALIPGGLILALRGAGCAWKERLATSGWILVFAALGGIGNGFLEAGGSSRPGEALTAFFQEGGLASVLGFGILGLPAVWLSWGVLGFIFRARRPRARS